MVVYGLVVPSMVNVQSTWRVSAGTRLIVPVNCLANMFPVVEASKTPDSSTTIVSPVNCDDKTHVPAVVAPFA